MLLEGLQRFGGGWEGDGGTMCSSRSCAFEDMKPEEREKLQTVITEVKLSHELVSHILCGVIAMENFPPQSSHRRGQVWELAACWEARSERAGLFSLEKSSSGPVVPVVCCPTPHCTHWLFLCSVGNGLKPSTAHSR